MLYPREYNNHFNDFCTKAPIPYNPNTQHLAQIFPIFHLATIQMSSQNLDFDTIKSMKNNQDYLVQLRYFLNIYNICLVGVENKPNRPTISYIAYLYVPIFSSGIRVWHYSDHTRRIILFKFDLQMSSQSNFWSYIYIFSLYGLFGNDKGSYIYECALFCIVPIQISYQNIVYFKKSALRSSFIAYY